MKKYTWASIFNALTAAIKDNGQASEIIGSIAASPCCHTVVNMRIRVLLFEEDASESRQYFLPIQIMVNGGDIIRAIIMEAATQLYKFGELEYCSDFPKQLRISNIHLMNISAYAFDDSNYAAFHKEQECGCIWLVITPQCLTAPFTYQNEFVGKREILKRSETNRIAKYHILNRTR